MAHAQQNKTRRRRGRRIALKDLHRPEQALVTEAAEDTCTPDNVHTHTRQPTQAIDTFSELLSRIPVLTKTSVDEQAFAMADYCTNARKMMETVIYLLESSDGPQLHAPAASMARLTADETRRLRQLRAAWLEHLRGNFYGLLGAPPSTGGVTARYSLAIQLWLMVAHANCILQLSDEVSDLFEFYPPGSEYLSRNALVVDDACIMQYPLRTLLLALECFVTQLDTLDRFHDDYVRYATALEHRIAGFVCHAGHRDEFNAIEWCTIFDDDANDDGVACDRVSDNFLIYSMVYMLTIYNYAENWCLLNVTISIDPATLHSTTHPTRWPAHCVADADWVPSARSMRMLTRFVCNYAHTREDDNYIRAIRTFLLQFELRPCDLDLYRVIQKNRLAFVNSVLQYEFMGCSQIARTYLRKVHYDRSVYSYVAEYLQFEKSSDASTRSAPMSRQGFTRQLGTLYVLHQFIDGKYRLDFKSRFLLLHRDASFVTQIERLRAFEYPVIVQQFSRFSVFVPHKRPPQHDINEVLYWRAVARAERLSLDAPPEPPALDDDWDANVGQYVRTYDCMSSLDAFAVWALWFLQMTRGRLDDTTDLGDFLLDLFGWKSSYWNVARA